MTKNTMLEALKSMDKIQWYEADFEEYCESGWDVQDSGYFVNDHYKTIRAALILSKAIREKRVLIVPVEPTEEMYQKGFDKGYKVGDGYEGLNPDEIYKAMTQAVDTDKLIEEITK